MRDRNLYFDLEAFSDHLVATGYCNCRKQMNSNKVLSICLIYTMVYI